MTQYKGKPISKNSKLTSEVNEIQDALSKRGLGQGLKAGTFDAAMESAVKLFQSRQVDVSGRPLKVDGVVGSFTWAALFGVSNFSPPNSIISQLSAQALATAVSQIGIMETLGQHNRGPQVDEYLKVAGISNPAGNPPDGYPWCQAFVYWCFANASKVLGIVNPATRTAGVLDHWNTKNTKVKRILKTTAQTNSSIIQPGMIFILNHGNGKGHTGFVESVYPDGRFITIEGNTNIQADREGLGVFRLERRKLNDKESQGFLSY